MEMNLVNSIAWSFARTTGEDFEELRQEAAIAYLEAQQRYDKKRGNKKTTVGFAYMRNRLIDYTNKQRRHQPTEYKEQETRQYCYSEFLESWHSLSEDAQTMIRVVLRSPNAFLQRGRRGALQRVREVFANKGWPKARTNRAIKEVRRALH